MGFSICTDLEAVQPKVVLAGQNKAAPGACENCEILGAWWKVEVVPGEGLA